MTSIKKNIILKTVVITGIALLLLIPAAMIKNLITEREATQKEAIREVSSKWGKEQTISGPFISVPYYHYVKQQSNHDSTTKIVKIKEYIHFLPSELKIDGTIFPEKRHRGIYDIVVYNSKIHLAGNFDNIQFSDLDISQENILFDKAIISLGISDLRGIENQISLKWTDKNLILNPGAETNNLFDSGISTLINLSDSENVKYDFAFDINLKGSQLLYFVPVGEVTDVNISSFWPNPSFNGAFLPDSSIMNDSGFKANWNILHLNRNYPQRWIGENENLNSSAFGVDLLLPIDNYQKATRSVKYAILFIVFTFLTFFFVEILKKRFIHPIQYLLVGAALLVFYTLLISISEYLNFNFAFIISAVATILLIAGYVKAILKSNTLTFLITGILLILYVFIFVIIQLQDFSLLIGSIGIFIILGLVMFFSRKIDWYNIYANDISGKPDGK